jgi:hypothetical protein
MGVLTMACHDADELKNALKAIKKCLKPDAPLLLIEPIHKGFLSRVLDMPLPEFINAMDEADFKILYVKPLHFWPARLSLCYLSWPAFITKPVYRIGQILMRLPGLAKMGDYFLIYAVSQR